MFGMGGAGLKNFSASYVAVTTVAAAIIMGALQLRVPYLNELASHLIDAGHIWRGAVDCAAVYRLPLGYAGFVSPFIAAFGDAAGVKLANLLLFACLVAAALAVFARLRTEETMAARSSDRLAGAALAAIFALYPYAVLNVARTTEAIFAAALVMAFFCAVLGRPAAASVVVAAVCIGLGMHVRPNMISLAAPALLWLALRGDESIARRLLLTALGVAVAAIAYVVASLAMTGCPWYSPTNGGYNLYAGNNPFAADHLQRQQNAEYSLIPALQAQGYAVTDAEGAHQVPQEDYVALAKRYLLDCPACAAGLAALKTMVFFSPRLANASGAEVAVQIAIAALTLLALALCVWRFWRRRRYEEGMLLVLFAAYLLPFVVTNADPRMRFPLDMAALCYLVVCARDGWAAVRGRAAT